MLVFKDNFKYQKPFNTIFLCGSKFNQQNPRDKRIVLKEHIESKYDNSFPVILEEQFKFSKSTQEKLSYDDIFLHDLASIEQLTSLFVDKIIVIHETVSTAAEIGMFSVGAMSANKLCVLVPDGISADEDVIGGFINLAFLSKKATNKIARIVYYPDLEINRLSAEKSDYFYYFHEDRIGENLSCSLNKFLNFHSERQCICFSEKAYGKTSRSSNVIDYCILPNVQRVDVFIHADALMIHKTILSYRSARSFSNS